MIPIRLFAHQLGCTSLVEGAGVTRPAPQFILWKHAYARISPPAVGLIEAAASSALRSCSLCQSFFRSVVSSNQLSLHAGVDGFWYCMAVGIAWPWVFHGRGGVHKPTIPASRSRLRYTILFDVAGRRACPCRYRRSAHSCMEVSYNRYKSVQGGDRVEG